MSNRLGTRESRREGDTLQARYYKWKDLIFQWGDSSNSIMDFIRANNLASISLPCHAAQTTLDEPGNENNQEAFDQAVVTLKEFWKKLLDAGAPVPPTIPEP